MTKLRRIALFGLGDNVHLNQILGLQRGFQQIGVECFAGWPLPTAEQMENFADNWRPDAIFEWDRHRNLIEGLDKTIRHLVWVQNSASYGTVWSENFGGSDIVYSNCDPNSLGYSLGDGDFSWLLPAVDESIFVEDMESAPQFDMIFAGFMPDPLDQKTVNQNIVLDQKAVCTVGDLIGAFIETGLRAWNMNVPAVKDFLIEYLRRYSPAINISNLDNSLIMFFAEHLVRLLDRKHIADSMLAASSNIAFFGPSGWSQWPEFKAYYRRNLHRPSELATAYRSALLNVHNSQVSMHHRTFEVMGTGRALLVNHNSSDHSEIAISNYFTPFEDFLWYEFDDLAEAAKKALSDRPALERIGRNAARRVREGHTWRHRAEQIARDIDAL